MICVQCGRNIANNKGDYSCDGCGVGLPPNVVLDNWNPHYPSIQGVTTHSYRLLSVGGGGSYMGHAGAGGSGGCSFVGTIDGGDR